jgi:hypothetical protein
LTQRSVPNNFGSILAKDDDLQPINGRFRANARGELSLARVEFVIKDANGFTVAYVYARQDKALWDRFLSPAEALTIATAIAKLPELIIAEGKQGAGAMNSRETAMLELAKRLNFHVEQRGSRFSLRRVADVSEAVEVENLSLEQAEEFLNNWKLRGFHGG